MTTSQEPDGTTRLAYILGMPLADQVERQWPQMGEVVRTPSPWARWKAPSRN
jgi:hypothetical protein